ncbi:sulfotransferase family protein [Crocosphaera sp. UHCC 0190]|uniref:sulfotransferase family protein n=1 Tax=Crocosphaera sp. UHCC 0190 TaxID=3110246 RepID=UPI002B206F2C|nr:sulfotransferase family protein [Crocosphaera sp. UHCC 0190]MEA5509204.1 sulfotransferase family protein [Crocosphaera sp. UHCC 0190]
MIKSFREAIRFFKNSLIYKYYDLRIQTPSNPYEVSFKKDAYKVLFILSHMRSGSSLLTHIVISNPAIKGYGETHIRYSSEADFKHLMSKVYFHSQVFTNIQDLGKLKMNHTYILDKLLHDNKLLNENLLKLDNFYFIFLVREPKRTLMSMLDHKPHWTEKEAIDYYSQRLSSLTKYSQIINDKKRSLLITHHQLINESESVFQILQNFLNTQVAFSENYQILNTTGKRHVGDFKENIRSGRIMRKPRELNMSISPHLLEEQIQNFDHCYEILSQCCQTISNHP